MHLGAKVTRCAATEDQTSGDIFAFVGGRRRGVSHGVGLFDASVGNHHRKFKLRFLETGKPVFVADFADGILLCAGGEGPHEPAGGILALLTL